MVKTREQWAQVILEHLRNCPGSFLTCYELSAKLTSRTIVRRGGGAGLIREVCEKLTAEGLLECREYRPEGAPYGTPYKSFGIPRETYDAPGEPGDGSQVHDGI